MSDTAPSPFAPPAPESIVHETVQPVLSEFASIVGGSALAGASENGAEKETTFEDRLAELQEKIAELPDTTSREIQINPNNPEHRVLLEDAMGWKLHLNFDAQNPVTVGKINEILLKIKQSGAIKDYKIGEGGGKEWDQPGKESTVYVGSSDKTKLVAQFISEELDGLILPPEGDTLVDDVLIAHNVMGRFSPQYDIEFHQYGANGIPFLKEEFGNGLWIPKDQQPAYFADLAVKSRARLVEKYGDYFTGSNVEISPIEGNIPIPRYEHANQVGIADLDKLYPEWRKEYEGQDPELVLLEIIKYEESRNIARSVGRGHRYLAGQGLERAIDQIPIDVGEKYDAHGIAGKTGAPSQDLDMLLKNGIDENRILYTKGLDNNPEAGGGLGADRPFCEGDLIVVSDRNEKLANGGIKHVLVGETYLKCFDLLRNRYPEVTFIPWHEAPDYFIDEVNRLENTKFVKNKIEYPNTYPSKTGADL